jgi:hypothetical protein
MYPSYTFKMCVELLHIGWIGKVIDFCRPYYYDISKAAVKLFYSFHYVTAKFFL